MFSLKDQVPKSMKPYVRYKLSCASCDARDIGKSTRHFSIRITEHLCIEKAYNHLQRSQQCKTSVILQTLMF